MKVLTVTGIFPPDCGGPASYVPDIARGLRQLGHEVVAVLTLSDRTDHDDSHYMYPVVRIRRGRPKALRWIETILKIALLARKADVVYLNGLVLEGILATKLLVRRPVVVKVVGDLIWERAHSRGATHLELEAFQRARLPLQWRLLQRLQDMYTALADRIITPSHYLARIVEGWGVDRARIRVVYNAVSLPPAGHSCSGQLYDLVSVARLVPWKGLRDLIEVAAALNLRLRIVGDGPLRVELESLARARSAQVCFAGNVARESIPQEIRSARLFVLNSSYEGLPHVVLEAKASGVAVLATAAGGTTEVIRHGVDGWLVPVGDKAALAEGIRYLLGNEHLRTSIAKAGLRQVREQFSPAAQLRETEAVLAEVCR